MPLYLLHEVQVLLQGKRKKREKKLTLTCVRQRQTPSCCCCYGVPSSGILGGRSARGSAREICRPPHPACSTAAKLTAQAEVPDPWMGLFGAPYALS